MDIRVPEAGHLRMVGIAPLAVLLLSIGVLTTREAPRGEQQNPTWAMDHMRSTVLSDSLLHTASFERIEFLSPTDSVSIRHFLVKTALNNPEEATFLSPSLIDEETLWLARGIYSESKRPEEQELLAWTIRNRVETQYRGKTTYKEVVLDPYQFSAFNPNYSRRSIYKNLDIHTRILGWQRALSIAFHVRHAHSDLRPFSVDTRHFYSERSMVDRSYPYWAADREPIRPERHEIDERRFRFYAGLQ